MRHPKVEAEHFERLIHFLPKFKFMDRIITGTGIRDAKKKDGAMK